MSRGPRSCAIVLAGGSGRRAGGAKQFERAAGRSLLYHGCAPFLACREIGGIVVVVPKGKGIAATEELDDLGVTKLIAVVRGGATRHESSRAGLAALPESCTEVLIHDAARPFVSPALIRRVIRAAREHGAAVPAVALRDSTIELDDNDDLVAYLSREKMRAIQTPQGFRREILESAFEAIESGDHGDDASVVLAAGHRVHLVEGEPGNSKITTAEDLMMARARLESMNRARQEEST